MNREKVIAILANPKAQQFVNSVRAIFKDLPHLPLTVREILVQIIPWLAIVGAVLGAIGGIQDILIAFGVRTTLDIVTSPIYYFLMGVLGLVTAYLAFLSFPLLRERKHTGWLILFWNSILSMAMSAISLIFGIATVIGFVLTIAVGFYLTFEIESLYSEKVKPVEVMPSKSKSTKPSKKPAKV